MDRENKSVWDNITDEQKQEIVIAVCDMLSNQEAQTTVSMAHFHRVVRKLQKQIDELKTK